MPLHVLIDTDAGVDDALALILALRSPELHLEAITTVAGNVGVRKCTRNVLRVLDLVRPARPPRVAEGSRKPLRRALVPAPEVHGTDGLGDVPSRVKVSGLAGATRRDAVEEILGACARFGKRLTIVALGPLTNLAKAWRKDARSLRKAGSIISMGGAFRVPGNTGPVAEFNYFVDPEAAHEIMTSGLPVRVIPLDVTERIILDWHELKKRGDREGSELSRFLIRCAKPYMSYHRKTRGFFGGYLHDPIAVAAAIDRSLFKWRAMNVRIETGGTWTRGRSVEWPHGRARGRVAVAVSVDVRRFRRLFVKRLWGGR